MAAIPYRLKRERFHFGRRTVNQAGQGHLARGSIRRGDIVMSASSQVRWRPQSTTRRATFSQWAIPIVFAAIAVARFAADKTVDLTIAVGGGHGELSAPTQLLHSWIDTAYSPFSRSE